MRKNVRETYDGSIVVDLGKELSQGSVLARGQAWVDEGGVACLFLCGLLRVL